MRGGRRALQMSELVDWTFNDFDDYGFFFITFVFHG